jgi:transcriptional regulator with XRE-family HTH domain
MTVGSDLARILRERRRELGLTRTRLAEESGLPAADIARWERGDVLPAPTEIVVLADAVGLDEAETLSFIDQAVTIDISTPEVAVEITNPGEPNPNPFADRAKFIRTNPRRVDRVMSRIEELRNSVTSAPARNRLQPPSVTRGVIPPPPQTSSRQKPAPGILPTSKSGRPDPTNRVYATTTPPISLADEERFYRTRRVATSVALIGLGLLLWWAVGELGDGIGNLLDLFRTTSGTGVTPTL